MEEKKNMNAAAEMDPSKYFKSRGVRMKLMLSFVLLITVTTGLMVYFAYDVTDELAHAKVTNRMDTLASVFSVEIEQDISRAMMAVKQIAKEPAMISMDRIGMFAYFRSRQLRRMNMDAVYVFDNKRRMLYSDYYLMSNVSPRGSLAREPQVREAMRTGRENVFPMPPKYGVKGGILVVAPIMNRNGQCEGVVIGEKSLDSSVMELAVKSSAASKDEGMEVFLTDQSGKILAHTNKDFESKSLFDAGMPLGQYKEEHNGIVSMDDLNKELIFKQGDTRYIGIAAPVSKWLGWRVALIQPYDLAFKPVVGVVKKILFIGFIAMLVGVGIALYRANRVIKPIGELLIAVEKMSKGNYTDDVPVHKHDEIGSLAFAFNKMKQVLVEKIQANKEYQTNLEEAYNQLQNDSRKREEANRELSMKVDELTTLSEVTQAITNTLEQTEVLDTITDAVVRVMQFSMCSIKLLDKGKDQLSVAVSRGLGKEYLEKGATRVGEGISGLAVKMIRQIIVEDLSTDTRVSPSHVLHKMGVSSVISIPLVTKNTALGVLNLYTKTPHVFTEDETRLLGIFANQAAIAIENARHFENLRENYMNTIQALSMAIDAKDKYTHGHSKRVKEISVIIGRELSLTLPEIEKLEYAADLHDIGKIGISEVIISKQGKLSVDEYELIKTHPLVGETIIEPVPFLQEVKPIIRHHHERWDGFGYPDGISGEDIPLLSRIILIADAYDAMTSDRPYRKALSSEEAVREILKHKGTQFDPVIVDAFMKSVEGNGKLFP